MLRRCALVLGLALAACGDGTGGDEGDPCHATAECDPELGCAGPNDPQACGIPPREGCASDADCGGERCFTIEDPCSPDGFGAECRPACANDPQCGAGFRCDAGACVAILCDAGAGVTCAGREVCDPARMTPATPAYDRTDGCYPVTCTDDDACAGRSCVNGSCQDAIGVCREPELVP